MKSRRKSLVRKSRRKSRRKSPTRELRSKRKSSRRKSVRRKSAKRKSAKRKSAKRKYKNEIDPGHVHFAPHLSEDEETLLVMNSKSQKNWNSELSMWAKGLPPENIERHALSSNIPIMWQTSPCTKGKMAYNYVDELVFGHTTSSKLMNAVPNYDSFRSYIDNAPENDVVSFYNLSGDTLLVVPTPSGNKNYSSILYFMQSASNEQIKLLWKRVALETIKFVEKHNVAWISTHGLGVPWLHIRISSQPKYYGNSPLANKII